MEIVAPMMTSRRPVLGMLTSQLNRGFHRAAFRAVSQVAASLEANIICEIGIDIINPVQVSATGMDSAELKREFGKDIVFWGGGVDTQRVLGTGTPAEVRADVKRRIEDFKPGGGFVFNTVHNIQGNVPAENLVAMWEALQEFGVYTGK